MNSTAIAGTLDSVCVRGDDKRVFLVVEVDDIMMGMPQCISVDITSDLEAIYQNVEFDKDFVKRIEKKLKLTLGKTLISLRYSKEQNWTLSKPLNQIYSPVLLTPDKVKFGDPLNVKGVAIGFKRLRQGKDFPMAGLFVQCVIGQEPPKCFSVKKELNIDVIDKEIDSSSSKLEIAYIDVDSDFDFIYNEIRSNRCSREKFLKENGKLVKRQEVYKRIAENALGKTLILEYDEYVGYSIWESLIYFIDENY